MGIVGASAARIRVHHNGIMNGIPEGKTMSLVAYLVHDARRADQGVAPRVRVNLCLLCILLSKGVEIIKEGTF